MTNTDRTNCKSTTGSNNLRNEAKQREDSIKKSAVNISNLESEYSDFLILLISYIINVPPEFLA